MHVLQIVNMAIDKQWYAMVLQNRIELRDQIKPTGDHAQPPVRCESGQMPRSPASPVDRVMADNDLRVRV